MSFPDWFISVMNYSLFLNSTNTRKLFFRKKAFMREGITTTIITNRAKLFPAITHEFSELT